MEFDQNLLRTSARIRRGELRSADVTSAILERIDRLDGMLHSTFLVLEESAMEAARRADDEVRNGVFRGPLHGVPIGIKDLLWTEGIRTTAGMEILADFEPDEDATTVTRLKDAGAVIVAKLAMTEAATFHHSRSRPRPTNPWGTERWTGASSSGSGVAVAAGFCLGAIGSDTGGSIRLPSAANNLTGLKPTWGRVSRHGVFSLAESFDTIGPMAHSAADAAAILQVIAGYDPSDPTSLPGPVPDYLGLIDAGTRGLKIGIDWDFVTSDVDAQVVAALDDAGTVLEGLGMRIHEVEMPWTVDDMNWCLVAMGAEEALTHDAHLRDHGDRYDPALRQGLENAGRASAVDVSRGYLARERIRGRMRSIFTKVDMLLVPAMARLVPRWEQLESMRDGTSPFDEGLIRFSAPFNAAGNPTISLPGGFDTAGMPLGIQLAGPWLSESTLLRAGFAFQEVTPFHTIRPQFGGDTGDKSRFDVAPDRGGNPR